MKHAIDHVALVVQSIERTAEAFEISVRDDGSKRSFLRAHAERRLDRVPTIYT